MNFRTPPKSGYFATVMAFSFGNSSMGSATSDAGGNAQNGPDLEEIQTEVGWALPSARVLCLLTIL